eukprot:10330841-Ditylum_brightwellii.AAC.1
MPTSESMSSDLCTELFTKLHQFKMSMNKQFLEMERGQCTLFSSCMENVTTKIESNEESLQKIESDLNTVTQTIYKLDPQLNKE